MDLANRPGTDFTDLPPAVVAAAPGDTLLLRGSAISSQYAATQTNKGLTILGERSNPPAIVASLAIRDLPAGQRVILEGFAVEGDFEITRARGSVFLQAMRTTYPFGLWSIRQSAFASFHRCDVLGPETLFDDSEAVLESSSCSGYYFRHGLRLEHSTVALTATIGNGGPGIWQGADPPCQIVARGGNAINARESNVTLADPITVLRGGSYGGCTQPLPDEPALAMTGGTLFQDPAATVRGIAPGSAFRHVTGPVVSLTTDIATGATTEVRGTVRGAPGLMGLTLMGSLWRESLGTDLGVLYLDLATLVVVDVGPVEATGLRSWSIPLPPEIGRGTLLALQSVAFVGTSARLSPPSFLVR